MPTSHSGDCTRFVIWQRNLSWVRVPQSAQYLNERKITMYTIKDFASEKFVLLNETDLLKVEDVNSITVISILGQPKKIKIHIGLFDYLFSSTLKTALRDKVRKDLRSDFELSFGI